MRSLIRQSFIAHCPGCIHLPSNPWDGPSQAPPLPQSQYPVRGMVAIGGGLGSIGLGLHSLGLSVGRALNEGAHLLARALKYLGRSGGWLVAAVLNIAYLYTKRDTTSALEEADGDEPT
jgi:hypothetical protein